MVLHISDQLAHLIHYCMHAHQTRRLDEEARLQLAASCISDSTAHVTTLARTSRHDTAGFDDGATHDKLVAQHEVNAAVIDMLFAPPSSPTSASSDSSSSSSGCGHASSTNSCATTLNILVYMYLEIGKCCRTRFALQLHCHSALASSKLAHCQHEGVLLQCVSSTL
jgi:hypothetical protein